MTGLIAPDPRLPAAGWRVLGNGIATTADANAYDRHRLRLGLPDGSRDMEAEKTVLLEAGFDELGGVSWTKGCYMGQELTARTKYRGLLKRRLVPVSAGQTLPAPGTPVTKDGIEVGTMRSSNGEFGPGPHAARRDGCGGRMRLTLGRESPGLDATCPQTLISVAIRPRSRHHLARVELRFRNGVVMRAEPVRKVY